MTMVTLFVYTVTYFVIQQKLFWVKKLYFHETGITYSRNEGTETESVLSAECVRSDSYCELMSCAALLSPGGLTSLMS